MAGTKSCHNCRRRRLRCDRSIPECHKCTRAGQLCLGYGPIYKWTDAVVGPGHTTRERDVTLSASTKNRWNVGQNVPDAPYARCAPIGVKSRPLGVPAVALVDPLLQGLSSSYRYYISYFTSRFCQDLVARDSMRNGANPFRELIPMSQTQPFLQHIIIAVSAIHYSRAMNYESRLTSQCSLVANSALIDALCARQKAIQELRGALERQRTLGENDDPAEKDALLATVLFFVNFALIDSGKDGWRDHLRAAGRLLSAQGSINFFTMLPSSDASGLPVYMRPSLIDGAGTSLTKTIRTDQSTLSGLILLSKPLTACDYVASDTAAYYIWNNALDSLASSAQSLDSDTEASEWDPSNVLNILLRTETNSYHSCPARLMYIVLRASRLAQANKSNGTGGPDIAQREACLDLLNEAQSFDVDDWAKAVCARNVNFLDTTDEVELACRRCIAATYRAAVCLYILLVAQGLQAQTRWDTRYADNESLPFLPTTADLVTTILHQLSFIPKESPFFKFTTWPVFLTGVETASPARRAWVLDRLQAMRDICPWGMLTSAMETLADIWRLRDSVSPKAGVKVGAAHVSEDEVEAEEALDTSGWLVRLQSMKIDCLIV